MVLDANGVVALAVPNEYTARAEALWNRVVRGEVLCLVPAFCPAEVISVFRQMGRGGRLTPTAEEHAVDRFVTGILPALALVDGPALTRAAWELARDLNERHTYDCVYLAIASLSDTEFWTADQQLLRRLAGRVPQARFLGDYPLEE